MGHIHIIVLINHSRRSLSSMVEEEKATVGSTSTAVFLTKRVRGRDHTPTSATFFNKPADEMVNEKLSYVKIGSPFDIIQEKFK